MLGKQVLLKDAFISYSSVDNEVIQKIKERFVREKISFFFAPSDIRAGDPFISEIEEGLRTSQVVVLFLTKASLNSYWVRTEWHSRMVQMANDKTFGLILVLLPGITDADIPVVLTPTHRLDFRNRNLASLDDLEEIGTQIVDALKADLPTQGATSIGVPFVIYAMTDEEARKLVSGEAFEESDWTYKADRNLYKSLVQAVEYAEADLPNFYGATRDDWRPPLANPLHLPLPAAVAGQNGEQRIEQASPSPITIRHSIEAVIKRINDNSRSTPSEPLVRPKFFSTDFLTGDPTWRDRTWNQLKDQGCILIVDVFSLCHPDLRKSLTDSGFSVLDNVSLVVLSPLRGDDPPTINNIIERDIGERLRRAFYRFDCELDLFCEFGVGNVRALNRWLYWTLPEAIKVAQHMKVNPLRRQAWRAQQGNPPKGMESLF